MSQGTQELTKVSQERPAVDSMEPRVAGALITARQWLDEVLWFEELEKASGPPLNDLEKAEAAGAHRGLVRLLTRAFTGADVEVADALRSSPDLAPYVQLAEARVAASLEAGLAR